VLHLADDQIARRAPRPEFQAPLNVARVEKVGQIGGAHQLLPVAYPVAVPTTS
jgi:hypothetical protein